MNQFHPSVPFPLGEAIVKKQSKRNHFLKFFITVEIIHVFFQPSAAGKLHTMRQRGPWWFLMKIRLFLIWIDMSYFTQLFKIIKFPVIWHDFDKCYVKKWSENLSKLVENGLRTRHFHRFWNYGLCTTLIWI